MKTPKVSCTVALAFAALLGFAISAFEVSAKGTPPQSAPNAASAPARRAVNEAQLVEHGQYVNKAGTAVHRPAHSVTGATPAGATARCGDATYSFSQSRRGTCSHHGGVSQWF